MMLEKATSLVERIKRSVSTAVNGAVEAVQLSAYKTSQRGGMKARPSRVYRRDGSAAPGQAHIKGIPIRAPS